MNVVNNDASQHLLLALLDQIEKLLADVREAVINSDEGGDQAHG